MQSDPLLVPRSTPSHHYAIVPNPCPNKLTIRRSNKRSKIPESEMPPGCARCLTLSEVKELKKQSSSKPS